MMDYTFKKVILPVVLVCFYWSIIASSLRQMNSHGKKLSFPTCVNDVSPHYKGCLGPISVF